MCKSDSAGGLEEPNESTYDEVGDGARLRGTLEDAGPLFDPGREAGGKTDCRGRAIIHALNEGNVTGENP